LHLVGIDYPKAVKLAADAGFSGFEVSPWTPRRLNDGDLKKLERLLKRNKIRFSGFTSIYPPEMILASPLSTARKNSITYTERLVAITQKMNGKSIVWGSGRSRNIPLGVPFKKGYGWLIELLRASAELADKSGVKIAIEPQNRFESTIVHNIKEALSVARSVGYSSAGVVYDTFHASLEEDSFTKPILLAGKKVAAVHISDCNRKIPGRGHLNFRLIFDALKRVGYDGYVTLEAILGRDARHELISARKHLERLI